MSRASRRASVPWYDQLQRGRGAASALDPALREVLLDITSERADAEVRRLDELKAAAARAADRHDVAGSLRVFRRMLLVGIPVWLATPIAASFGSVFVPGMATAVFVAAENGGRTSGDAPVVLYQHLAVTIVLFCVAVLALNLLFGLRVRFLPLVWLGGIGGFGLAAWSLVSEGGAMWQWDVTPVCIAGGYLVAQALTSLAGPRRT